MYALDKRDAHYLLGGEDEDLRLVCMFTPALQGDEAPRLLGGRPRRSTDEELVASYAWTAEQKALRKSLERALRGAERRPHRGRRDAVFPREKWKLVHESDVLRLIFDPAYGGLGHDALTMVYVLEHLGYGCRDRACCSGSRRRSSAWRCRSSSFGSDDLKERYLRRLIDGEILGAHAISEPGAGSDATAMATIGHARRRRVRASTARRRSARAARSPTSSRSTRRRRPRGARRRSRAFICETDKPGHHDRRADPEDGPGTSPFGELEFNDYRDAEGERARQAGRRVLHPRARHDLGDPRDLRDDGRRHAAPHRALHQLRQDAQAVRRADRLQPVHRRQDRRAEDRRRDLAQAPLRHGARGSRRSAA